MFGAGTRAGARGRAGEGVGSRAVGWFVSRGWWYRELQGILVLGQGRAGRRWLPSTAAGGVTASCALGGGVGRGVGDPGVNWVGAGQQVGTNRGRF